MERVQPIDLGISVISLLQPAASPTGLAAVLGLILAVMTYAATATAQSANQIRDLLRSSGGLGEENAEIIQGLTGFAVLPGVSTANFTVDSGSDLVSNADVRKMNLPLSHQFAVIDALHAAGTPRSELTAYYAALNPKAQWHAKVDVGLADQTLGDQQRAEFRFLLSGRHDSSRFSVGMAARSAPAVVDPRVSHL